MGALLVGCGGGGGGDSSNAELQSGNQTTTAQVLQTQPTESELHAASRIASWASLGMNYDQIRALAINGHDSWLEEQLSLPVK